MQLIPLLLALACAADTSGFRQSVDYTIEARLDEVTHVLAGRLRLDYGNRSPATLDTVWFHLHLNAFRPASAWARRELEQGSAAFQRLGPDEHAFERVRAVAVDGQAVEPVYPLAPDSTVMAVPLPRPLLPGEGIVVDMDWDARLSTLPRRQGRRGRHYDFAHWYPRVAVYDADGWHVRPLLPQGEFHGEFASYDVVMEVAADQVVGASGVPVEGDPGWESAATESAASAPRYRRDAYAPRPPRRLGMLAEAPAEGERRIRWRAEDVHHFAWSASPDFRYEGGAYGDVAVHVLLRDDASWAGGTAVRRTEAALAFYDTIFGAYAWPQITNLHRIERGGTEFPMLMMNGSPSVGLILHEVGHNYVQGIMANNEWRETWLDEGFVTFLVNWAHERSGRAVNWRDDLYAIRQFDRLGLSQPIGLEAAEFRDMETYAAMSYAKAALVFRMLHWLMGAERFEAALRLFYEENRLRHISEADLRAAVNAVSPEPLDWFFDQWIHTTATLDYRIGELSATQSAGGRWRARVEVIRQGDIWMPVDLRVNGVMIRLEDRAPRQLVELELDARPEFAVLDPDEILIDIDPTNNAARFPD
jgi:hypothetical protein